MITIQGCKRQYTGKQVNHQKELPKSAKLLDIDYTDDLKELIHIYLTNSGSIYLLIK
nr:hypothetical protein [uncultured Flavobacterium sp.]